eukprot:53202-Eustigmatos_ZCMA.PRE.1
MVSAAWDCRATPFRNVRAADFPWRHPRTRRRDREHGAESQRLLLLAMLRIPVDIVITAIETSSALVQPAR